MRLIPASWLLAPTFVAVFGAGLLTDLCAGQFGLFDYEVVEGSTIEITGYPSSAVGAVSIPEEIEGKPVTSIGTYAFRDCAQVTSITLPSALDSVGFGAFSGCRGITSMELPQAVSSIGVYAFQSCTGMESIFLPRGVSQVHGDSFASCRSMTSIEVDEENPNYSSVDGVLFDQTLSELIRYPCGRLGVYNIPEGTVTIGDDAFAGCTDLTSVIIPQSTTLIASSAFEECRSLTEISIPSSVTSIGRRAFQNCVRLQSFTIPEGVSAIEDATFLRCDRLTSVEIPDTVTTIGDHAFNHCEKLSSITIPDAVTSIGDYAFRICSSLSTVTIPANVTSVGEAAFSACESLTTALFLGDAPSLGQFAFIASNPDFAVYFLSGRTGFTTPSWNTYPAIAIDPAANPAGYWLVTQGFPHETDMGQDINGDGIELLLAYALNLNPRAALAQLPRSTMRASTLELKFFASRPGIAYTVEASEDMVVWTTTGVTLSEPDSTGYRNATISLLSPCRFMRIRVED